MWEDSASKDEAGQSHSQWDTAMGLWPYRGALGGEGGFAYSLEKEKKTLTPVLQLLISIPHVSKTESVTFSICRRCNRRLVD